MDFHITEISNNSEEKENTVSKQKKGKELAVTGLIREKSFPFLNTGYLEFTEKETSDSKNSLPMQLVNRPARGLAKSCSQQGIYLLGHCQERSVSEYGETGKRHSFRLLYVIVIQYAYAGLLLLV